MTRDIRGKQFRHFKGGRYVVLHLAKHSEGETEQVVYLSLDYGTIWVRRLSEWEEPTNRWPDGVTRSRFVLESELPKNVLDLFLNVDEAAG
jgi:hypothetical protein